MPWFPDPFTGGLVWKDLPDTSTALDAANLNAEENAEAAYSVHNTQTLANYMGDADSAADQDTLVYSGARWTRLRVGSVGQQLIVKTDGTLGFSDQGNGLIGGGGADVLGRTQVLGTSTIKAPSLPQFVSVTDAPWGAKGDAKRVTDGSINAGTNQLSSATASFATGQRVDTVGAGPAGAGANTLFAFVGSVSGGVASLVTTLGGSTPANATNTVSGAMVTYGTEDTGAFQSAHNALTAAGGGVLYVPANRAYLLAQVIPTSSVTVWAYRATLYLTSYNGNCGFMTSVAAVNFWTLRGGVILGDNVAYGAGNRVPVFINTAGSSDIEVFDLRVTNNRDAAIYLVDIPRCRVVGNRLVGCCQAAGRNAINISSSTTVETSTDVEISGNYLQDNYTLGIHFGLRGGLSATPNKFRAVVTTNRVIGNHAVGITMEASESGPGGPGASVIVANNPISLSAAGSVAISIGNSTATQGRNVRWVIQGNDAEADAGGITINASDVTCTGNVINVTGTASAGNGISTLTAGTTATATLDGTTAVLTSVTYVTGATPVTNGLPLSGTGIPSGSYIVSGGGTATVTISQATTAAATETVSVSLVNSNVNISANTIHMAATSTTVGGFAGLLGQNLADSLIENNTVLFDAGGTSFSMYGIWLSNSFATSMRGNHATNAPRWGARFTSCHDCEFSQNKIRNPNQNGTADIAVQVNGTFASEVDGNRIWDDTGASKITSGLSATSPVGTLRARRNTILNATSTPIAGSWLELGGNRFTTGAASGRATLVAGTVTVSTNEVVTGDSILLSTVTASATIGALSIGTIVNKTSFVIQSTSASDTSTVYWEIRH